MCLLDVWSKIWQTATCSAVVERRDGMEAPNLIYKAGYYTYTLVHAGRVLTYNFEFRPCPQPSERRAASGVRSMWNVLE